MMTSKRARGPGLGGGVDIGGDRDGVLHGRALFLTHDEWKEWGLPDDVDVVILDREAAKKTKTYRDLQR